MQNIINSKLEEIESILNEADLELLVEGENMFIRTTDEENVFLIGKRIKIGKNNFENVPTLLLPRRFDDETLVKIK